MFILYQENIICIEKTNRVRMFDRINVIVNLSQNVHMTDDVVWIVLGLVSLCGTMAVGVGLSYILRPIFITRYLFPTSAMMYLVFGYCISKMKLRKIWALGVLLLLLGSNIPTYFNVYKEDNMLNKESIAFLSAVIPSDEAVIYTNNVHLGWTLLEYYYPNNQGEYISNIFESLTSKYDEIWVIWTYELEENTQIEISKKGYKVEKVYTGYLGFDEYDYVYKIKKVF